MSIRYGETRGLSWALLTLANCSLFFLSPLKASYLHTEVESKEATHLAESFKTKIIVIYNLFICRITFSL